MRVLIIDDEVLVRKSLERAFRARGHEILLAENGDEGLALWQRERPEVVLIDVLMPGLTGPQVLAAVDPALRDATTVALMSAFSGAQRDLGKEHSAQVDAFIPKPFEDIFSVVDRIRELHQK